MEISDEKVKQTLSDFSPANTGMVGSSFSISTHLDESTCIEALRKFPVRGKDAARYYIVLDEEHSPRRFRITQMVSRKKKQMIESPFKLLADEEWQPNCFILGEVYGDPNIEGVHIRATIYSGFSSAAMIIGGIVLVFFTIAAVMNGDGRYICFTPLLWLLAAGMMIDPYYERQRFVEMVKKVIQDAENKK